ncbi:uncharacterized protein LOC111025350 [Momordica charantia]|uniref:Uncharacterized protein LOC111025350 n=1 Tax=Momordica charantia TaxID=3673 RepID=A0A6J1DYC8_MOMCH|nr:uncharacterized protein LOC111025350 [Momordica charantia]
MVGQLVKSNLKDVSRQYRPKDIINNIQKNYKVNVRYKQAWPAKDVALNLLIGSLKESYTLLRKYGRALKAVNVDTVFEMELEEDKYFKYAFMALGCCIIRFSSCIRLVLVIDGAHLKGKYKDVILIASSVDEVDGLLFVSNRPVSITKSVREVFPQVAHRICMQHLSTNLKNKFKNDVIQEMFILAAKTFRKSEFRYYFSQFAGFPEVQSIALLEHARVLLQCWFYEMRTYASSRKTILTNHGETKMRSAKNLFHTHSITPIDHHELEVCDGLKMVRVNLNARTCGCKEFDYFQLPCSHAIAAATHRNVNRYTLCSPA